MRAADGASTSGVSGRKATKCQDEVLASHPPPPNLRGVKLRVSSIALRLAGKCHPDYVCHRVCATYLCANHVLVCLRPSSHEGCHRWVTLP